MEATFLTKEDLQHKEKCGDLIKDSKTFCVEGNISDVLNQISVKHSELVADGWINIELLSGEYGIDFTGYRSTTPGEKRHIQAQVEREAQIRREKYLQLKKEFDP